jgi:hypothetical protein
MTLRRCPNSVSSSLERICNAPESFLKRQRQCQSRHFKALCVVQPCTIWGPFVNSGSNKLQPFRSMHCPNIQYCFWPQQGLCGPAPWRNPRNDGSSSQRVSPSSGNMFPAGMGDLD